jgi:hypothetical protein
LSNKITSLSATDIRFPTSEDLDGSDATNKDPDYSAAYIAIETEQGNSGLGQKPPVYLAVGDKIKLGIDGLGTQSQTVVALVK